MFSPHLFWAVNNEALQWTPAPLYYDASMIGDHQAMNVFAT
jgi:hypothetical protein